MNVRSDKKNFFYKVPSYKVKNRRKKAVAIFNLKYSNKIIVFTATITKMKYLGMSSTVNVLQFYEEKKNIKSSLRTKQKRP